MSEEIHQSPNDDKRRRSARIHIALIGTVAVFPVLGSFLLYQFWKPSAFINHGELIAATQQISPAAGDPMGAALKDLSGKWTLATVDSGACDEHCKQKLYYLRQIRLTQGKEMDRIERLWIVTDGVAPTQSLMKEYQGTKIATAPNSTWVAGLPVTAAITDYIFIIDPLGNLVLRYPRGFNPTGMKKDLSRLLRASRIG